MSTSKQTYTKTGTNVPLGKRKKTHENKGSYLCKWLDKTMQHAHESTPSMDTYDSYVYPWPGNNNHLPATIEPYRLMYGSSEPVSLPTFPTYCTPPIYGSYVPDYRYIQGTNKSVQVQRPRIRIHKAEDVSAKFIENQDFASLPPLITSVGDSNSNSDKNTKEDNSSNRRFSDPCVHGLPDVTRQNRPKDSASDVSSGSENPIDSRLITCLLDQVTALKMANEKLSKDLQETKVELYTLRQQSSLWQKGSTTSLGATPNHSPLGNNGYLGIGYSPGVLTDIVREIRDAARLREEALYSRVRTMVLEKTDANGLSSSESKQSDRSLEEIKSSMRAVEADKRRMLDRIDKLEGELRLLRVTSGLESQKTEENGKGILNVECARLRKELIDARLAKQQSDEHALKLERLVTQLQSKCNGLHISTSGPESLPSSEAEHDTGRTRRTSVNSTTNSAVVFGPVTDL